MTNRDLDPKLSQRTQGQTSTQTLISGSDNIYIAVPGSLYTSRVVARMQRW